MRSVRCHVCGSDSLYPFFECKDVPVHSCLMVSSREAALEFPRGDLRLEFCQSCGFIQNSCFDPGQNAYSEEYEETQEFSARFREFQHELCNRLSERYALLGKTVLEIGCGKGSFLEDLARRSGCNGVGFDPSYRPDRQVSERALGLRFIQDFYSEKYADVEADLVCCRHTLEHIQPVHDFLSTVAAALEGRPETPLFFEVPDTERILRDCAFEDIYYEHCSYFTLGSLERAFRAVGFDVTDLYKAFGGQYLMIEGTAGKRSEGPSSQRADDLSSTEELVHRFEARVAQLVAEEKDRVDGWISSGSKLAIWGSGSKAVSYLGMVGLESDAVKIVDINPHKHGKFLAGTGHCIVPPVSLEVDPPDVVLVMNSIYREEIASGLAEMGLYPELALLIGDASGS